MTTLFGILLIALGQAARPVPTAAPQPIGQVRELATTAPRTHVVVVGTVTRYRLERSIAVHDQSGSIFVYVEDAVAVAPGDLVEVEGIAETVGGEPCINNATYRKVGTGPIPLPTPAQADDLAAGHRNADLVSVEGTLARIEVGRFEYGFVVRSGTVDFTSWVLREMAGNALSIQAGSTVRVTGVVSLESDDNKPSGFELLMRTGADAVVLKGPPWWTTERLALAVATLSGTAVLVFFYSLVVHRQVRRQTAVIREQMQRETELQEQFRQAQKMESIGRLSGGIAHNFNNLMTVVIGHSDILGMERGGDADLMASVNEIRGAAVRATKLTRQLLAFGRQQTLAIAPVDLNIIVRDMAGLIGGVIGESLRVRAEPAHEPVIVSTDRSQLEQALLNLAVNARDAMPNGGTLSVTVTQRQDNDARTVGILTVSDTGHGIAPEVQPHIFEPFYSTKDAASGSGLGLAMVYGFVQQTGGTISFTTTVGRGTTFELSFPLAQCGEPNEDMKRSAVFKP